MDRHVLGTQTPVRAEVHVPSRLAGCQRCDTMEKKRGETAKKRAPKIMWTVMSEANMEFGKKERPSSFQYGLIHGDPYKRRYK